MSRYIVAALTPLFKTVTAAVSTPSMHRGWGDQIEWHTFGEGLKKASAENKHLMLIVHVMTCPACVKHKVWFSRSKTVADLSSKFVMVNVEPSEIPRYKLAELAPDGHYVPRIMFLTPNGQLLRGVRTNNPNYGYAYMEETHLVYNMKSLAFRSQL